MMQSTDFRKGNDPALLWRHSRSWFRTILGQRQMRATPVIVFEIGFKDSAQMSFVENNHVIQAVSTD
jgi:hypothetical protein